MTLSCIQQPHPHLNANLDNGVLTLAINRPEAKNALYGELYLWIAQALDEADQSNAVRCVIYVVQMQTLAQAMTCRTL